MRNIIKEYNSFAKKQNKLNDLKPTSATVLNTPTTAEPDDDWASAEEEYEQRWKEFQE